MCVLYRLRDFVDTQNCLKNPAFSKVIINKNQIPCIRDYYAKISVFTDRDSFRSISTCTRQQDNTDTNLYPRSSPSFYFTHDFDKANLFGYASEIQNIFVLLNRARQQQKISN